MDVLGQRQRDSGGALSIEYTPLDEDREEIRLITFSPSTQSIGLETETPLRLVRCRLETVSLKEISPVFADSVKANPGKPRRRVLADWITSRNDGEHRALQEAEVTSNSRRHVPGPECYRYTWGDYAALSYVWGDPNDTVAIIVNGKEAQVSRNLERVLRAFSINSAFTAKYKLWVDALCINQSDYKERGRQVQKMRTIYGNSWSVIAWLGEEADGSSKAFRLIERLALEHRAGRGATMADELREHPEIVEDGSWLAFQNLVERPYWYRLWIIQEITLGGLSTIIYCGTDCVHWETFLDAVMILFEHFWELKDPLLLREAVVLLEKGEHNIRLERLATWTTKSLHLIRHDLRYMTLCEEESGENSLGLSRLLNVVRAAQCRDDRDLVYGLVGLMNPTIGQQLDPDYTIAPKEVFAKVTKAFIVTSGNLDPIRYGNPWGPAWTPSWAADWRWNGRIRYAEPQVLPHGRFWKNVIPDPQLERRLPYHAGGSLRPSAPFFSSDDKRLTCSGVVVDQVTALGARSIGYFHWSRGSIIQDASWTSCYGENTTTALYKTLLMDRVAYGEKASDRHSAIFRLPSKFEGVAEPQFRQLGWKWLWEQDGYYFRWERWRAAHKDFLISGRCLDGYFTDTIPNDASEYDYTEVYSCFDRTCKARRFMLTRNGYMGWAPENTLGTDRDQTRKGDLIAIIFGCSTPIVLRPVNSDGSSGEYHVLGEAYVQGLMDGEGIAWLESGKVKAQEFVFV